MPDLDLEARDASLTPRQVAAVAARARENGARSRTAGGAWRRQLRRTDVDALRQLVDVTQREPGNVHVKPRLYAFAAQLIRRGYTAPAIAREARVHVNTAGRWATVGDGPHLDAVVEDAPHDEPIQAGASATDRNPVPEEGADRLIELQLRVTAGPGMDEDAQALDLLCAQLNARGYTQQAIGNVIDVSRKRVQQRIARVPKSAVAGIEVEVSRTAPKSAPLPALEPARLTDDEASRARELQPLAGQRRAGTDPQSPAGRAYTDFMDILVAGMARGVNARTMAEQIGVTPAAIRFRLQRVFGGLPPSMQPKGPTAGDEREVNPLASHAATVERMRGLLDQATVRPGRGPFDPDRLTASRTFDSELAYLVRNHSVPLSLLAVALGRSRSALATRLVDLLGNAEAEAVLAGNDP